jgi:DNA-binding SARP family transcriptional activator/tetratricopeptide (TPR) repeat protein
MTELHLLGSTDLQGPEPERFRPVLTQPKVLALLCYLALARPRGFHRRDTLLGMLWPELDQARGRGALRKAIYELRQALGADAILSRGAEEVRLNDAVVSCDAVAFEEAVEAGELERAVGLYRGEFLTGFFLADGAGFEQWLEGERQRLARSYRTVLERLAERAVAQGDRHAVVTWWRRVSEQDPYSTRVTLRLMEALDAAGDRAGALRYAEQHAARLREELEAEPAPDVVAFAERLRAHPERHASLRTQAEPGVGATERFERFTAAIAGRYTIQRELGAGGMATVYLAADHKHQRKVAVKVLRPELAAVLGAERFLNEIKVTANLQHPHILPLHDSGAAAGFLYYVMPFVAGHSLREKLTRETHLGVEEAVQIAEGVATALDYAHRQGVIHRDIKPENILLHEGQALVADFGIALAVTTAGGTRLTGTGLSPGTPAYMSPEQAVGEPAVDARSDVYALGCVVYEMLAGEPPFTGPTAQAVLARQALDPVSNLRTIRTTVPEGVVQAVERALAKVPADRFATAAEFGAALTTPVAGPVRVRPAVPPRRTRRLAVLTMIAAAVLALGAGSLLWLRPPTGSALVPNRVVVAPFENHTGDPDLDHLATMVPEWVSQGLVETRIVQIVPTNTVRATIASGSTPRTGVPSPVFLALQTGAGIVVSGSYYRDGEQIRFQTQIIDAARDEVIVGLKPVSKPLPDVMLAVDSLRHRVMAEVAQHLNPRWEGFGRGLSRPPSYEAYREFTAGFEAFFSDGDFPEALRRFERAFALDSTYWGALVWVANVYSSAGDRATADSLLRLVDPHRDELGLIDRKNMEWIEADLTGRDIERRYQSWKELAQILAQITPSSLVMAQLGVEAYMSGRFREAIEVFANVNFAAPGLEGNWGYFRALTEAHHMLGQHRRELREARRARRQYPSVLPLLLLEARALAALGRPDDVTKEP